MAALQGYYPAENLIKISNTGLLGDELAISVFKDLLKDAIEGIERRGVLVLKFAINLENVTGVGQTTLTIHRYDNDEYSIDGYKDGAKFALAEFVTTEILLAIAGIAIGGTVPLLGAIAIGAGTILLFKGIEEASASWFGLSSAKVLNFYDQSGILRSGMYYPNGLDGTTSQNENAARDFIFSAHNEIVNGGTIKVSDTTYTLYNGSFTSALVAASAATSVNDFLLAGDQKNLNAHAFAPNNPYAGGKEYYFFKDNNVALDIPVMVGGLKQVITVNNIYDGVADSSHLMMGSGSGKNLIMSSIFSSSLSGSSGDDLLLSGTAGDTINGGSGNDIIIGGKGNDTLTGGIGVDTFVLNPGDGIDTITDADNGDNIIFDSGTVAGVTKIANKGLYQLNDNLFNRFLKIKYYN